MGVRCFISIEPTDKIKKRLKPEIDRLTATAPLVKWVSADNLHLTLRFLGDTDESLIPNIGRSMLKTIESHRRLHIKVKGLGAFPNLKNPHIAWIGMENSTQLDALQKDIESAVRLLGFAPDDKLFKPHLTIARIRSPQGITELVKELSAGKDEDFGIMEVDSVCLMKSELSPSGPKYERLLTAPLG